MDNNEYAIKLIDEAKATGEAVSDVDSTVIYFKNGEWNVTDNGESYQTTDRNDAIAKVVENLNQNA